MKAISLWQPWASAIAIGVKQIETRGWQTSHRGPIAIHAAQMNSPATRQAFDELLAKYPKIRAAFTKHEQLTHDGLPFGAVIATANLLECVPTRFLNNPSVSDEERALGNYELGRFGWILADIKKLPAPIPVRGGQRIFNVSI